MNGYISWLIVLLFTGLSAFIISRYSAKKFKGKKSVTVTVFLLLSICAALLMLHRFGCTAITLKGIILFLIFITSSYQDIKTHECDDYIHPMIIIAGFIGRDYYNLPNMLISAFLVFALMMGSLLITKSSIGGADVKFSVACAFALGVKTGLSGLITGLTTAIIINLIKKNKKEGFPMIPYLAVGFTMAYFV